MGHARNHCAVHCPLTFARLSISILSSAIRACGSHWLVATSTLCTYGPYFTPWLISGPKTGSLGKVPVWLKTVPFCCSPGKSKEGAFAALNSSHLGSQAQMVRQPPRKSSGRSDERLPPHHLPKLNATVVDDPLLMTAVHDWPSPDQFWALQATKQFVQRRELPSLTAKTSLQKLATT